MPVQRRIDSAKQRAAKRAKGFGRQPEPVTITGPGIAKSFWGKAWCKNLESYSDFSNRLPRGRTYARNGSVVDLLVTRGRVEAIVAGSMVYDVAIAIAPLSPVKWRAIKADCAGSIGSLVDLLTGRLDDDVMRRLVRPGDGMFPSPREVKLKCSCPDGARLCKHLAAVFYGIGSRLDARPEMLFVLRGVEQTELVAAATKKSVSKALRGDDAHALAVDDLAGIFGIDLGDQPSRAPAAATRPAESPRQSRRPTSKGARSKPRPRASTSRGKSQTSGKRTAKGAGVTPRKRVASGQRAAKKKRGRS